MTTVVSPPVPPAAARLAFTGSQHLGDWIALGVVLFLIGVTLMACDEYRKRGA